VADDTPLSGLQIRLSKLASFKPSMQAANSVCQLTHASADHGVMASRILC